ncbi:hypothetical protein [Burkholderia sola]
MFAIEAEEALSYTGFLLIRAAHLKRPTSLDAWIAGARQLSTFMAAALDLESMANALIRAGLAKIEDRISIEKVLDRLWAEATVEDKRLIITPM